MTATAVATTVATAVVVDTLFHMILFFTFILIFFFIILILFFVFKLSLNSRRGLAAAIVGPVRAGTYSQLTSSAMNQVMVGWQQGNQGKLKLAKTRDQQEPNKNQQHQSH